MRASRGHERVRLSWGGGDRQRWKEGSERTSEMMEGDLTSADINLIGGERKLGDQEIDDSAESFDKPDGIGLAKSSAAAC